MLKINRLFKLNRRIHKTTKIKKSKLTVKKIFLFIILIIVISLTGIIIIVNSYLNKINKISLSKNAPNLEKSTTIQENTTIENEENIAIQNIDTITEQSTDIENIALFGIDETEGTAGRSDCIMILTLDKKQKELKLSSMIRDSYVNIPTKDKKDKINHAYAFGGPKLALETLNENFNLNIDKFITVNFSSLPKIINDVDGITLDITDDELKYINGYIDNINKINNTNSPNITTSGNQQVDGTQALAYCRIRYTDGGDFERSHRHRIVLSKLFEKSKTLPITQYPFLLDEILPIIHTNLEKTEILSLAVDLNSLKNVDLLQNRFPCDEDSKGELIDGIYYYVFDKDSTTRKMHDFIFKNDN